MLKESVFKFYGLGIVMYDKLPGSTEIHVLPVEELNQVQGKLREVLFKYDIKVPDHQGIKRTETMEGGLTLTAKWINVAESNRTTAPDVYTHETVLLLKVADNEQIYWTDILNETSLRRLETVRYSFSNLSSGREPYDGDSSYWLEFDTRNKGVRLHTSENDGEFTTYDIDIQTRDGTLTIKDGLGNIIHLNSRQNRLEVTTLESMKFKTKEFEVEAETSIKMNSPTIEIKGENVTTDGSSVLDLKSGGSLNVAGGNVELSGSSVTCEGEDLKIDRT